LLVPIKTCHGKITSVMSNLTYFLCVQTILHFGVSQLSTTEAAYSFPNPSKTGTPA